MLHIAQNNFRIVDSRTFDVAWECRILCKQPCRGHQRKLHLGGQLKMRREGTRSWVEAQGLARSFVLNLLVFRTDLTDCCPSRMIQVFCSRRLSSGEGVLHLLHRNGFVICVAKHPVRASRMHGGGGGSEVGERNNGRYISGVHFAEHITQENTHPGQSNQRHNLVSSYALPHKPDREHECRDQGNPVYQASACKIRMIKGHHSKGASLHIQEGQQDVKCRASDSEKFPQARSRSHTWRQVLKLDFHWRHVWHDDEDDSRQLNRLEMCHIHSGLENTLSASGAKQSGTSRPVSPQESHVSTMSTSLPEYESVSSPGYTLKHQQYDVRSVSPFSCPNRPMSHDESSVTNSTPEYVRQGRRPMSDPRPVRSAATRTDALE
eukprot:284818702_5